VVNHKTTMTFRKIGQDGKVIADIGNVMTNKNSRQNNGYTDICLKDTLDTLPPNL